MSAPKYAYEDALDTMIVRLGTNVGAVVPSVCSMVCVAEDCF